MIHKMAEIYSRRRELNAGRLIRNLGGGSISKKMRLKGQNCFKGDERILGDRI